ncbi:MAG: SRPBCC family protein [Myxococcales bacterium]|nr:SRPBCC family protein [Myxococcales bacterium]
MPAGSFTCEVRIRARPERLAALLGDLRTLAELHPLIERVDEAPPPRPGVRRFWITDRLHLGPFRPRIRYRADVLAVSDAGLHVEAYQRPATHVTNHTTLTPEGELTRLHEAITIRAPRLILGYALRQAEAAHREMLARLKDLVERAPA